MSIVPILLRDSFLDVFLRSSFWGKFCFDGFPEHLREVIDLIPVRRRNLRRWPCVPLNQIDDQMKDSEDFEVSVDVQNFKPAEISVKVNDKYVTVDGKHEEKQDEHGFVSRHFVRKYRVPDGHDLNKVVSSLSSDGVLTIKVPRLALAAASETKKTELINAEEPAIEKETVGDQKFISDTKK